MKAIKKALTNIMLILLSVVFIFVLLEVSKRIYDLTKSKESVTTYGGRLHPLLKNNKLKQDLFSKISNDTFNIYYFGGSSARGEPYAPNLPFRILLIIC